MSRTRTPAASPIPSTADPETAARLLDAAVRCFARHGYAATTVREICREAGVNGAAAHYHFGSKHDLYVAVVREACRRQRQKRPLEVHAVPPEDVETARARLRATVRQLARVLLEAGDDDDALVLLQELRTPTDALDVVVAEFVRPRFEAIRGVVRPFLPGVPPRALDLAALSVLGQIAYYRLASPVALRLLGQRAWGGNLVGAIVDHVVRFSERALGSPTP